MEYLTFPALERLNIGLIFHQQFGGASTERVFNFSYAGYEPEAVDENSGGRQACSGQLDVRLLRLTHTTNIRRGKRDGKGVTKEKDYRDVTADHNVPGQISHVLCGLCAAFVCRSGAS
ncbi:MAG: hypothetical protein ACLURV_15090 [Gallintestinimicrobium sp.]